LENRVIFASRGRVVDDARNKLVNLRLFDGSIHSMGEDLDGKEVEADMKAGKLGPRGTPPAVPRDELVRFSSLEYRIDFSDKEDQKESPQEYTVGQIIQALRSAPAAATGRSESASKADEKKRKLLVEWAFRTAISLACVAFVLLGIPLAIFVKPSGKSTGAAIAFALILVYYWMIKWGSSVAEEGGNFGFFIIFLPNVLMAGLGAYLFRRAARL
jgi:lipopolysaccharide export system permease protein